MTAPLRHAPSVTVRLKFRPHQLAAHGAERRFQVYVWHRRAGKTFYVVAKMFARALEAPRADWRAFYVAPTYRQAKSIAWDYLTRFSDGLPGLSRNESELRIDLANGARIQLLGAEGYDSLRGRYADDLTIDETALIPGAAWTQVLSPMLADRKGRATFIGTPAGRMNLFYDLWTAADPEGPDPDPEWGRSLLTYRDTDALDPAEVARLRRTMREEEFAQELECSWNAAIRGAYFARELTDADQAGRITTVRHDAALPVNAALDLGWSDLMVAVFHQQAGTEHRLIGARAWEWTAIPDMIRQWREELPFRIDCVVLPHDARVHELTSGRTRQEVFEQLGYRVQLAPRLDVHEGIEQTRMMLKHAWLDREECRTLIEALLAYRSEFDEVRNVHRVRPVHDWSSHWADAVRTLAVGRPRADAGSWSLSEAQRRALIDRGVV